MISFIWRRSSHISNSDNKPTIINYMTKGHHENLIKRVLKIAVGFLPAYLPGRIYQIASTVPLLKSLVNVTIKSIIPASIKITEGEILLNKIDVAVSGALALGMFEKRVLAMLRSSIKNGMNVIDIGANIGLYTVISSRRVGPSGKVFAYEPEEENFSLLSKNIEFNKLKNVTPIKMALANVAGNRTLYMAKDNKGHHSFSDDSSSDKKILVPTDTLDQSLIKYGSPKIDLIKMDIEGAEPLALEGMSGTI